MTVQSFFEGIPECISTPCETGVPFDCEDFANIVTEAVYVLDFQKRCFHYVADHEFFLCGYSQEEVMSLGYDFFQEVIHPEDLSLWEKMHNVILKRLEKSGSIEGIDYFSCSFRLKCRLPTAGKFDYLMAYQKLKPKYIDGQLRFGICTLSVSVIQTSGKLRLYYKNKPDYETYSIIGQKWRKQKIRLLNDRQKAILILAKQGKSRREVACILCVSVGVIDMEKTFIFEKLGVSTTEQAIIYATNHRLIFSHNPFGTGSIGKEDLPEKQDINHSLTANILERIQEGLKNGQSVNALAKKEGFSETALRKAIKCGKLKKQNRLHR
jgi:DNA-binding CsgD family transcriptional regulator